MSHFPTSVNIDISVLVGGGAYQLKHTDQTPKVPWTCSPQNDYGTQGSVLSAEHPQSGYKSKPSSRNSFQGNKEVWIQTGETHVFTNFAEKPLSARSCPEANCEQGRVSSLIELTDWGERVTGERAIEMNCP